MPDPDLSDIRSILASLSRNILLLPEVRPSDLPPQAAAAIGDLIGACDTMIRALAEPAAPDAEVQDLLSGVRAHRRLLFLVLAAADPGRAGPWTEACKATERATDAKVAAGLVARFARDETFEQDVRARWLGEIDP